MKPVTQQDLEQLFELSVDMLSIIRADGTFKHVNPAWSDVLGWSTAELIDTPYITFVHPEDHSSTAAEAARLAEGARTIDFENRYRAKDGSYRWMSWRVTPSADGSLLYCATHDVTERRRVREQIQVQAAALEAARAEAVRANVAKSDFLSRMSHELRTPLNAILGFAQLFDRDRLNSEERDNIRHILEGGRHLLDLINEVIDISRVESGTLALSKEPVELQDAIDGAVNIIRPLARQHDIALVVGQVPTPRLAVLADRQRLRQVLLNLLANAVKYNRKHGAITVWIEQQPGGRVHISVADTGAGIPPQLLTQLFQPFERLGAEKTSIEGTGLGLALSHALCVAMGGTLTARSVVDEGSVFTVDLPQTDLIDENASAKIAAETSEPVLKSAGTVLYVEDNVANVKLMERILSKRAGISMLHAGDGHKGIDLARECRPALILLDLQLPEMSGETVLGELWKDPGTRRIPVVVLTADATRGLSQRLIAAGAKACLTKPLDVQQVLRTIDELLLNTADA